MAKSKKELKEEFNSRGVIQAGGLSTDSSLVVQPEGTTRFVLNGINETNKGDLGFISNEESNEQCYQLPTGFIPIGQVYVGEQEKVLFLASPAGNSIIALVDRECLLTVLVNDTAQSEKLGFSITHQIDATYRLRRGCERTLYWVDPKVRTYVIEKPEEYQVDPENANYTWNISSFSLFKTYKTIPSFEDIKVLNSGGNLLSGSYNFAIQYLDDDLNPTEFITTSETINIYADDLDTVYKNIEGSSNLTTPYYNATNTTKSIKLDFANLDTNFPFYKIGIIEANNGSGQVSGVKYSAEISTSNTVFVYTGDNYETIGSEPEIAIFKQVVESASTILQVENRLLLSDTKGKKTNLCNLQKYASRIKADCTTKVIELNSLQGANPKVGEVHFEGAGYMPGEIYSFGIVYIFKDNSLTPVYHIPGKNPNLPLSSTFIYNTNPSIPVVYPMSQNNTCVSTRYTDNNLCSSGDYWGEDSEGAILKDQLVRHHRFPLRSEIDKPLFVNKNTSVSPSTQMYGISVIATSDSMIISSDPDVLHDYIVYKVEYSVAGVQKNVPFTLTVPEAEESLDVTQNQYIGPLTASPLNITITETRQDGTNVAPLNLVLVPGLTNTIYSATSAATNITYTAVIAGYTEQFVEEDYESEALGIIFSGIEIPSIVDTNGEEIIGYFIVRQERTDVDKTILDSAVLLPTLENKNYVSHGLLMPRMDTTGAYVPECKIRPDVLSLLNPEFKFHKKLYVDFDEVIKEGEYTLNKQSISKTITKDVMEGSSFDKKHHRKSEDDGGDGWQLQILSRDTDLAYTRTAPETLFTNNDIRNVFYLDALSTKSITNASDITSDVYNVSCDNKIGIINLEAPFTDLDLKKIPYVVLKKFISNPYANFRTTTYYKESKNPVYFSTPGSDQSTIFNGDSYIGCMKYVSTVFYENRIRERRAKDNTWTIIAGGALVVIGVVAAIFSAGTSLGLTAIGATLLAGAGAAAVAAGGALIASGIRQEAWVDAYEKQYALGLRETVEDSFLYEKFKIVNPSDDEIRWLGDGLTNLWFESNVNIGLRQGANIGYISDYIPAPTKIQTGNSTVGQTVYILGVPYTIQVSQNDATNVFDTYLRNKLTFNDPDKTSGKQYSGVALAEVYDINKDYFRRNKQKQYEHLGLEYDCCSDCVEQFPTRVIYSEQSFQEELTDNFSIFLPQNYRDIEGETGRIVDMFRIQTNLYIHTEEALWHLPQNYQERVTGDVVSFIGTGGYFDTPPRKIVDASDSSAGTYHKWGKTKTKNGVLFPCHREKKWYLFNGQELQPISDTQMTSVFRENMNFLIEEDYFNVNKVQYPYSDNPSSPAGTGYISVYDSKKERFIITKKDFKITNLPSTDYFLCQSGSSYTLFNNYQATIDAEIADGAVYLGIENCRMKFKGPQTVETIETRYSKTPVLMSAGVYKINLCKSDASFDESCCDCTAPDITYTVTVSHTESVIYYVDGVPFVPVVLNNSYTMSYSLKFGHWVSWHTYLPSFYMFVQDKFYSWRQGGTHLWRHNKIGEYQRFYGDAIAPFIVEYVDNNDPLLSKITDGILFQTEATTYDAGTKEFIDAEYTFNQILLYNTRQISGWLSLQPKTQVPLYLNNQLKNITGTIIIDRNERDWTINDFRDFSSNNVTRLFNKDLASLQGAYFIDKVINPAIIDVNKPWYQLESFRDKFLVVRLLFNTFANVKLIFNFSVDDRKHSER
jgi:hypothetical protein